MMTKRTFQLCRKEDISTLGLHSKVLRCFRRVALVVSRSVAMAFVLQAHSFTEFLNGDLPWPYLR